MIKLKKTKARGNRAGAAVVEFAVCLPLIVLIVLGTIEAGSLLFLKQTLVQAAYEGAKVAIVNGDPDQVEAVVDAVAASRNLTGVNVQFTPSDRASVPAGETITITISAPGDANSLIPFGPFRNQTVQTSASMVRE